MFIKKIKWQSRRDLGCIFECEFCGKSHEGSGYDDDFFHNEAMLKKICPECGKHSKDNSLARTPKYPEHFEI